MHERLHQAGPLAGRGPRLDGGGPGSILLETPEVPGAQHNGAPDEDAEIPWPRKWLRWIRGILIVLVILCFVLAAVVWIEILRMVSAVQIMATVGQSVALHEEQSYGTAK